MHFLSRRAAMWTALAIKLLLGLYYILKTPSNSSLASRTLILGYKLIYFLTDNEPMTSVMSDRWGPDHMLPH